MTSILRVLSLPAAGSGYSEDLAALHETPMLFWDSLEAAPITPDFRMAREVAEIVSVGLVVGDPDSDQPGACRVAWGECVGAADSGIADRSPVFRSTESLKTIANAVVPFLEGKRISSFRELATGLDRLTERILVPRPGTVSEGAISRRDLLAAPGRALRIARSEPEPVKFEREEAERPLQAAIRYGVSQALLSAAALSRCLTMAEIIAEEWELRMPSAPVPIQGQAGSALYDGSERMLRRRVSSLSYGPVGNIPEQVGADGSEMTRYLRWLAGRIGDLGDEDYSPAIHLDLRGALGKICDHDLGRMLGQLYAWELAAKPYSLRIESPMLLGTRDAQIREMKTLREYIRARGMRCQLVADEWANTLDGIQSFLREEAVDMIHVRMPSLGSLPDSIDAVLRCRDHGVGVLLGGSNLETDLSARVSAHVALATQPDLIMAKPGTGVDESISYTHNEMARTLAEIAASSASPPKP